MILVTAQAAHQQTLFTVQAVRQMSSLTVLLSLLGVLGGWLERTEQGDSDNYFS